MKTDTTDELWSTMAARGLVAVDRNNYERVKAERDELAAAVRRDLHATDHRAVRHRSRRRRPRSARGSFAAPRLHAG